MEMVEGRRYRNEPAPINDSLERHYKAEIKRLEETVKALEDELTESKHRVENLKFKVKLKDIEIESLVKSMAEGGAF
jgi:predicted  nucleic acid-binding Zn-ribbon protein